MPNNLPNTGIQVWNDTTDAQGNFKDYYNMLSGVTNSNMVKIDNKFGDLINQLGYFNFYNNLGQLGLKQGSETIDGIFSAMSNFSMALIVVNTSSNPTQYPNLYGTIFFQKQQTGRLIGKFVTNDGKNEYLATFSGNAFSGWQKNAFTEQTEVPLINGWVVGDAGRDEVIVVRSGDMVSMLGRIYNPSSTSNGNIPLIVPSGFRPTKYRRATIWNEQSKTAGHGEIKPDGSLVLYMGEIPANNFLRINITWSI